MYFIIDVVIAYIFIFKFKQIHLNIKFMLVPLVN